MLKTSSSLVGALVAIALLDALGLGPYLTWIILGVVLLEWHRKKMDKLEGRTPK